MAHVLISMSSHNRKLLFSILGNIHEVVKIINIPMNRALDGTWLELVTTIIRPGTTCGVQYTEDSACWTTLSMLDQKEGADGKRNQPFLEMNQHVFQNCVTWATLILQLGAAAC